MISFKEFLSEKAMSAGEFAKAEKRQGGKAKIGFEFECIITKDSPLYIGKQQGRRTAILGKLETYNQVFEYFDIDQTVDRRIQTAFKKWSADNSGSFRDFMLSYGSIFKFIAKFEIEPNFGWEKNKANDSSTLYTEENESDEPNEDDRDELYTKVGDDLSDHLDTSVTTPWRSHKEHRLRGEWLMVPDDSINPEGAGAPIEIISPPTPLTKALTDLKMVFDWMKSRKVTTNSTTGLHINISLPGIENIDPVKLVLFLGEKYVLKSFNRVSNSFTKSQVQSIINNVTGTGQLPKEAKGMIALAKANLSMEKYSSVNLSKLVHGYLEFRLAGGAGYENDYEKIRSTILRFITALEIAIDPAAERNEYLKKLARILDVAAEGEMNTDFDARPLGDILDIADQESITKSLQAFLEQAKKGKLSSPAAKAKVTKWVEYHLIPSLGKAFKEMAITTPSDRHRAELRLILKKLDVTPEKASPTSDGSWTKKAFGLTK